MDDTRYTLMCKLFPASPLTTVKGNDGSQLLFESKESAEAERTRLTGGSARIAGGGPYYFVVPVQSSSTK